MNSKWKKTFILGITGVTLGSTVLGSSMSVVNASENEKVSVSTSVKNLSVKQIDKVLLDNGFTYSEVKTANLFNKRMVYSALVERSDRGEFAKKLEDVLRHCKGHLRDWLRHINILDFVGIAVSLWNAYDGEPTRVIYHTLRHFGVSRHEASRWSRVIVSALGYL